MHRGLICFLSSYTLCICDCVCMHTVCSKKWIQMAFISSPKSMDLYGQYWNKLPFFANSSFQLMYPHTQLIIQWFQRIKRFNSFIFLHFLLAVDLTNGQLTPNNNTPLLTQALSGKHHLKLSVFLEKFGVALIEKKNTLTFDTNNNKKISIWIETVYVSSQSISLLIFSLNNEYRSKIICLNLTIPPSVCALEISPSNAYKYWWSLHLWFD